MYRRETRQSRRIRRRYGSDETKETKGGMKKRKRKYEGQKKTKNKRLSRKDV